jgi:hypothetical protein
VDCKRLFEVANHLFTKKLPLNSLWQEVAEQFYVERATFTIARSLGQDFASHITSSYPLTCRRELGNQISTMLRDQSRPWFHPVRRHVKKESSEVKAYLEGWQEIQRLAMYDQASLFVKSCKQGDHDFAAFGQCAISVEMNRHADGLLYRCWHLRDMAWQENEEGQIGFVARKWKPTAQTMVRTFKKADQKTKDMAAKTPFEEVEVMHMIVDADMYDGDARGRPRWSIWYDVANQIELEATPIWGRHYIIPRWQTVSDSQYSYSPATVCALPDARLLQAMTWTLLEAGEKAANPPVIATQNAVRSDVALYAGGLTWVDEEYDERLGEALRPLTQDFRGYPIGVQLNESTRAMLHKAFFLDALTLPQRAPEMTAYEVGQRVQEYVRGALPLFEPMEQEYNSAICDETFGLLWRAGAFGNPASWPRELQGASIDFTFESPLHDAIEQAKGQKFQEASQLIATAVALDPAAAYVPNAVVALRDALTGVGIPADWMNDEETVQQRSDEAKQQAQQQQLLANLGAGSDVVKNIGQSGMVPA